MLTCVLSLRVSTTPFQTLDTAITFYVVMIWAVELELRVFIDQISVLPE